MVVLEKTRIALLVLLGVLAVVLSSGTASAQSQGCVQECLDRWMEEREACDEARAQALTRIDAQEEACKSGCKPGDYFCQGQCMRQAEIKRRAYDNQYRRCLAVANTIGWNCYRACASSESRP